MVSRKKSKIWGPAVTLCVVVAFGWLKYHEIDIEVRAERSGSEQGVSVVDPKVDIYPGLKASVSSQAGVGEEGVSSSLLSLVNLSSNRYQVWKNCTILDNRGNDGDSFHIRAPHSREEVRLYYVDAPESAARSYRDGNTNHQRIAQQGAALGGLNQSETTEVGVAAKVFVKKLLHGKPFTVVTEEERVYNSHRKYAFVIVDWKGQPRYLHELLVAHGLARIHTKPKTLPDNTAASRQKQKLRKLEDYAKSKRLGAWSLAKD